MPASFRASAAALLIALPLAAQPPEGAPPADTSIVHLSGAAAGPSLPRAARGAAPQRRSVEHSDLYYKRLTVHRWTSYAIVPLFAAQYVLGERLMEDREGRVAGGDDDGGDDGLHGTVAAALAATYGLNAVTGAWNWWDDRHEPAGRTRRTVHSIAMLLAGAGFVATGVTADGIEDDGGEGGGATTHRDVAIASMGLATASTVAMWLWKD